ncbi:MAG: 3-hydroxyacyl-[acyl-carrier-protein] dehydratase FabA, partial [Deltaproteobacteria bacterium]|nr:3-hydroxyacyl-[acyl-carrier-protein] dehydratase FabA [Deltaproteobacteria bacterium]
MSEGRKGAATLPAVPQLTLTRAELEMGANGSISTIFGPEFAALDAYRRVVRMPEPPLLLADRVLDLEGPPRVLGKGRIITETDIKPDSWYLHDGRMPGGLMIESGQADLLLGSWQGIDWLNQGERIYRLLGCTLTYQGELPRVGETLRYDIRIDQHAKLGDVRMFFFRYDCHVGESARLVVREGQAGFFSDAELAQSGGVIWEASGHDPGPGKVDPPVVTPSRVDLDRAALEALGHGDLEAAFGPAFGRAHTHTWTPRTPSDRMLILDRVSIDPDGGPWQRGYLRGELDIHPGLWFFHGHFHNDPCMPGTLMFDGCLQAMYILLASYGYTLHRDGWRFEPAKDIAFKLRCRGQVIPSSKKLTYEIFVTERVGGPVPRLVAQVLCTVDGLKCFHADPLVVELVPDWPLERPAFADHLAAPDAPAEFGWKQMLSCAWGRPTDAFGPMYKDFDGHRKVPRLPGPPYHFMSRVTATTGEMGSKQAGASATVEYDVPPDAWYFQENAHPVMPWAVLLEAALQPCGWLASWSGCAVGPDDFLFRNLDGTATIHREVTPRTGKITTVTRLDRVSKSGGMILVAFTVKVACAEGPVVDMSTVFGFFPPEAFVNQVGVGSTEVERDRLTMKGEPVAMPSAPAIGRDRLRLLDRAFRLDDGSYRGEKDVSPRDWFFAAHFYQDPVQPGSLGIEALVQLLQVAMVDRGLAEGLRRPRFEPTASGEAQAWKYRGQVVPENKLIQSDLRIVEVRQEADAVLALAEGSLWVDGKRIYALPKFAMRLREDERPDTVTLACPADHCPTWTRPAAPMMSMALAALAHAGATSLADGVASRWLTWDDDQPRSVPARRDGDLVILGEPEVFRARLAPVDIAAPAAAGEGPSREGADLYESGELFHGPGFQAVQRIEAQGAWGATVTLRAGLAPEVLLDGMTHGIPHDAIGRWFPDLGTDRAAYPARLLKLGLAGPLPSGPSRVELRPLGVEKGRPRVGAWLYDGHTLVAHFELEEVLLPKGPIGRADPGARRDFLQTRYTPGVSLARHHDGAYTCDPADVRLSDWLPGTVEAVYGTTVPAEIAAKDTASTVLLAHPRDIVIDGDRAFSMARPLVSAAAGQAAAGPDLSRAIRWWRARTGAGGWPGEAVIQSLAEAYLRDL